MPQLANYSTAAPETIIEDSPSGDSFPVSVPSSGDLVNIVLEFTVPRNELWEVLYIGATINTGNLSVIVLDGVSGFVLNQDIAGATPARVSASGSLVAGTPPAGSFALTPSILFGNVGPNRRVGMLITVHTDSGVNRSITSGSIVAEIRRFRLGSDAVVTTLQNERAAFDNLNQRLLLGRG